MKKLLAILLTLSLLLVAFVGCGDGTLPLGDGSGTPSGTGDGTGGGGGSAVRLGGMTGPTSIGMAKLLADDQAGASANDYEFVLAADGADMKAKLLAGEVDIAAIPANLAATLHKATGGKIQVIAVNTLGVVSLLETGNTVASIADLAGKTVYAPASAKGAIPEIVFSYLLAQNGLTLGEDVQIEWLATAPGGTNPLAPKLKAGEIVLSPEPAATALLANVEGACRAVVFDDEWKALSNGSEYITGVTVVRREFAEQNPDAVAKFLTEYEASIKYANENPADAAAKVVEFKILEQQPALIANAIPNCHISFLAGAEMKAALSTYYGLLVPIMPTAFGGAVPADDLYYVK